MKKGNLPDRWFYLPIVILLVHLLYRLVDQSAMISYFPLDFNNDVSSYIAQLHFFDVCGFHNYCGLWYNGFTAFLFTPPGWYHLSYPLLLVFGDPKVATYFSILLLFALSFIILYGIGKWVGLSRIKSVALFSFFFGNAIAIGNFIRLGRVHELTVWFYFFIFIFTLLYYKNRKLDWKFVLLAGLSYGMMQLSYLTVAVLVAVIWLGYLLVKSDKLHVIGAGALSILTAAYWTIPLALNFGKSSIQNYTQGAWLWIFTRDQLLTNIAVFFIPLALLGVFYYYWKSHGKEKKELLLWTPLLVLAILFFLRLTPFIPLFQDIFPDPYLAFFLFFTLYFFLQSKKESYGNWAKLLPIALILVSVLSVSLNVLYTPNFVKHTDVQEDFVEILPQLRDGYFIVGQEHGQHLYSKAYYSYSATENKATISGWYPEVTSQEYLDNLRGIGQAFKNQNCEQFKGFAKTLKVQQFISYGEDHKVLEMCGYEQEFQYNQIYAYK